jgi:hypothetical protein
MLPDKVPVVYRECRACPVVERKKMPIDDETLEALREALKGPTLNDHPMDWDHFYRFVVQMYRLGPSRPTSQELARLLSALGQFNMAAQLVPAYTHGIGILTASALSG